jgi:hypothetical protein
MQLPKSQQNVVGLDKVVSSFGRVSAIDWLRARRRAMCVSARKEEGQRMQNKRLPKSPETILRRLASLEASPIKVLKQQWRALYGSEPPHRVSRKLLTRAVAYRIQEQARGGLKLSTRRLLVRLGNDARGGQPLKFEPTVTATAGTVLVRDWHGTAHEVRVLDQGVLYKRKRYRSLTEVARLITGAHWNGPRFFGLRSKPGQEASHG